MVPGERAVHCFGIGRIDITHIGIGVLMLSVLVSQVYSQIFNNSYKRYSYLRLSYKFDHQQFPNDTKNGTFGVKSRVEKLGLVGYQNFLE